MTAPAIPAQKPSWFRDINPAPIVVLVLILALALVGSHLSDRFGTLRNFSNLFGQMTFLAIIALGQTFVILTRGIDLSIGSTIAICAVFTSGFINNDPDLVLPITAAMLVFGVVIGMANATLAHLLRVHPLIITLGMAVVLRGVMLLYTEGTAGGTPDEYGYFAQGRFAYSEEDGVTLELWSRYGLSLGGCVFVLMYALAWVFLNRTRPGRNIYAVGGDPEAARLSGISVWRTWLVAYGFCGFCSALAAVYLVSQQGVGSPDLAIKGYELDSITPVVVGGTMLLGGVGGVVGTLVGVVLLSMLNNLLNFMDVSTFYQWIVQGVIIILAVSVFLERRGRP